MVSQARSVGYRPLLAESLALTGLMYAKAANGPAAEKAMVEAYRLADSSGHDEVRAEVATNLVFVSATKRHISMSALRWSETAAAVLQRLGGHEVLRAWLFNNLGCAYSVRRDGRRGSEQSERGRHAQAEGVRPRPSRRRTIRREISGSFCRKWGGTKRRWLHADRAIEIFGRSLVPIIQISLCQLNNRGEILNGLGRYQEARESFEKASVIWERELGRECRKPSLSTHGNRRRLSGRGQILATRWFR